MPSETAHDQSYKLLFSQPEMIAALLEGIIQGDWQNSLDGGERNACREFPLVD